MNAWLATLIETKTGRTINGRNAHPARCRTCKAWTLTGLDSEFCAFTAIVDPTPLNPIGEALTLLAGIRTYQLQQHAGANGGRPRLTRRQSFHITAFPAGAPAQAGRDYWPGDVVADHRCSQTTPNAWTAPSKLQPATSAATRPGAPCPF